MAAAGGHNLLMSGPPGSSKILIARAMPGILPKLDLSETLDITCIYSVVDMLSTSELLVLQQSFRAPHRTISYAQSISSPLEN